MRIQQLKIRRFRNLRNFEITFTEDITMLLGKNGSAKSNLLEAIALIFSRIELGEPPPFAYYLRYECNSRTIEIDTGYGEKNIRWVKIGEETISYDSFVNEKAPAQFPEEETENAEEVTEEEASQHYRKYTPFFPSNVFIYYSGQSNRLAKVCAPVKRKYKTELREGNDPRLRRVFLTDGSHSSLILFTFFADGSQWAKDFLRVRLGITELLSARLSLTRPPQMEKAVTPILPDCDYRYWYAGGTIRDTIRALQAFSIPLRHVIQVEKTGSRQGETQPELQGLHLYFNSQFRPEYLLPEDGYRVRPAAVSSEARIFRNPPFSRPKGLFQALDDLNLARYGLKIHFRLKLERANQPVPLTYLSEGEQQLLTVIGLLRFTKENDTLFLLDEPDTHLNPQWSYEYKQMLEEAMGSAGGSQIIMATHDPVLIAGMAKENVRLMERKSQAEAPDEAEWIIKTRLPNEDPRGQSVARILEGELFDLPSALSAEILRDLERKRELAFKDELEPDEKDELRRLARELRDIDLTQVIEDPLYTHFVQAVVKHPDYLRLKEAAQSEARFPVLNRIAEEVRDEMLRIVEGDNQ